MRHAPAVLRLEGEASQHDLYETLIARLDDLYETLIARLDTAGVGQQRAALADAFD